MKFPSPGLFVGTLRHRRFAPTSHAFRYPVFLALLDVDRIPELMAVSRFTGYNRFAWASFDERDHFGDPRRALRDRLRDEARRSEVALPEGPVYLLTNLRYLGYAFNPVSFFYCYGRDGRLGVVLAEVNNTFGETHNYWLTPATARPSARAVRHVTPKVFHVSPFNPLMMEYEWVLTPPADRLVVHINVTEAGSRRMDATLALERRPWSPGEIRRALLRHPWMTARVIAAIHYQALRLYAKGTPFHPHPGTPPSEGRPRRGRDGSGRRGTPVRSGADVRPSASADAARSSHPCTLL